ncbi:hypothetical protein C8R45DRAFT_1108294 [Mycena sanguinolenta]|nr:hypothetical protein C8R45DRAFT_1108294 [Mycena sanguinolenta]
MVWQLDYGVVSLAIVNASAAVSASVVYIDACGGWIVLIVEFYFRLAGTPAQARPTFLPCMPRAIRSISFRDPIPATPSPRRFTSDVIITASANVCTPRALTPPLSLLLRLQSHTPS